jgi:phosphate-selective porin OprO/OprP
LYFLTGEHDHYSKKNGFFERVTPTSNAFWVRDTCCSGPGAWQVGARYDYLDLNDNGLNGGILHNITGGLNWFLNPNMKMQFNYVATHRDAPLAGNAGDGWIHGWGMRVAHDF